VEIAFFGLPIAALLLHADGVRFRSCAIARRGVIGSRRLHRVMRAHGVPVDDVPDLSDPASRARIVARGGDLLVSWYWVKNIPREVRDAYALGSVGVHPSLLPRHRGPDPFFWTIDRGDHEAGVSAHRLADEYDTGAVLAQRRIRVEPTWTAWRLAKKLDRPSLALLRDTVRRFANGEPLAEQPQDHALATLAPSPTEDELEIDWNQSSEAIERRVRAAAPWPGAFMFFGEEALTLTRVRISTDVVNALVPGEGWVSADRDGKPIARVRTATGAIELAEARFDAAEDEPASAEELLNQADLADAMANAGRLA